MIRLEIPVRRKLDDLVLAEDVRHAVGPALSAKVSASSLYLHQSHKLEKYAR